MIVTIKQFGSTSKRTLQEAVELACNGDDYERGKLETIEKSLQYTQDLLSVVLQGLNRDIVKQVLEKTGKLEVIAMEDDE